MIKYYTAITALCVLSMASMLLCVSSSRTLSGTEKRYFRFEFSIIALAALCEWLGVMLNGTGPRTVFWHRAVKVVEFSAAPCIGIFMALILDAPHKEAAMVILLLHTLLQVVLGFSGAIIQVDAESNYTRGPLYEIYMVVYVAALFYAMFAVLRSGRKYQFGGVGFLVSVLVFVLSGMVMQMVDSTLRVDYVTTAISAIMLYVFTVDMIQQTDGLTGLINRRGYENTLAHLREPCVILFFDVDCFKSINDTYGHAMGDRCLRLTGRALWEVYSRCGHCFRIGGDEFCVILMKHMQSVESLWDELVAAMAKARQEEPVLPKLSMGYAIFDPEYLTPQEAIEEADQMMYRVKQSRKKAEQAK